VLQCTLKSGSKMGRGGKGAVTAGRRDRLPHRGGERDRLEEGEGYDRRGRLAVREGGR
jgi:hypothetical protein